MPDYLYLLAIASLLFAVHAASEQLVGKVVSVADGDTLTVLVNVQQFKIRLAEIDTPERRQPWVNRAKQALANKVFGEAVRVEVVTTDRYGRAVGRMYLGNRDTNRELVAEGHAWVYRKYNQDKSLLDDEQVARDAGLGLWSQPNPVPPWEWRRR